MLDEDDAGRAARSEIAGRLSLHQFVRVPRSGFSGTAQNWPPAAELLFHSDRDVQYARPIISKPCPGLGRSAPLHELPISTTMPGSRSRIFIFAKK